MFYWILFFLPFLFLRLEFSKVQDKIYTYICFKYVPLYMFILGNLVMILLYFVFPWWAFALLSTAYTLFCFGHAFNFDVLWKWTGSFMYKTVPFMIYHIFICYRLVFFWNFNNWEENQLNSENLAILIGPIFYFSIKNKSFLWLFMLLEIKGQWFEKS